MSNHAKFMLKSSLVMIAIMAVISAILWLGVWSGAIPTIDDTLSVIRKACAEHDGVRTYDGNEDIVICQDGSVHNAQA